MHATDVEGRGWPRRHGGKYSARGQVRAVSTDIDVFALKFDLNQRLGFAAVLLLASQAGDTQMFEAIVIAAVLTAFAAFAITLAWAVRTSGGAPRHT